MIIWFKTKVLTVGTVKPLYLCGVIVCCQQPGHRLTGAFLYIHPFSCLQCFDAVGLVAVKKLSVSGAGVVICLERGVCVCCYTFIFG